MLYIQMIMMVILLGLSGFFSSYETAITSLSRIQVHQMVKEKKKNAELVQKLRDKLNDTIITILIGNNLVNIGASALATIVATDLWGSSGVGMAIGGLTFFVLIFGEITPKAYATQNAEKQARSFARIFYSLSIVLKPIIWILNKISTAMIRMIGGKIGDEPLVTAESLKAIAEVGVEEGVIGDSEKDIIHRVVEFNSTTAKNIMTARVKVLAVDVNNGVSEIKKIVEKSQFSRIPVYDKSIDHVIGILLVRDFLKVYKPSMNIRTILKHAHFVTVEEPVDKLLKDMQARRAPISIVLGVDGGFAGVVTLEDIMEELVGDIYDETDIHRHLMKHIDNKTIDLDADVNLKDIDTNLKVDLPKEKISNFGSLNEFILNKMGRIPEVGEKVKLDKLTIEIKKVSKHKIETVRIRKK